MLETKEKIFLLGAAFLFAAAALFAGVIVWHDTRKAQPAPVGVRLDDALSALPHFPAGNLNGTVTAVSGNTVTIAVMVPVATSTAPASGVSATVIVDNDTRIYRMGATKNLAAYNKEADTYVAGGRVGFAPDPYEHIVLTVQDLKPGLVVNVLPKLETVQGTTLHAQSIMSLEPYRPVEGAPGSPR